MKAVKQFLKSQTMYTGCPDTATLRQNMQPLQRRDWPYVTPDEGDILYFFAKAKQHLNALEIGFATGSTSAYILQGLSAGHGNLTSIDFAQDHFERAGVKLVQQLGFSNRHTLLEENSILCLPRLYQQKERYGLIFLDGWKSFDHLWVDCFYCAKMLLPDGYMVFDDARMPAVQKCISLLKSHYLFQEIDTYPLVGGWRQRAWHLMLTRGLQPPYVTLQKIHEIENTPAGKHFDFWAEF